jgi:hypothetical protein
MPAVARASRPARRRRTERWERKSHRMPRGHDAMANCGDGTEGRVFCVEKLLAGGKELSVGRKRLCSLAFLGRCE